MGIRTDADSAAMSRYRDAPGTSGLLAFDARVRMTGSSKSSTGLDARRRRLLFRSWHRGSRELDLIIGPFVDAWIDRMSESELDAFEELLQRPEPELYDLVVSPTPPPDEGEMLRRLRAFHSASRDTT
jgi:antitoxin CptB